LGPKVAFAGAVAGTTADIAPGEFLGIASVPGGVLNRALEVVVFGGSMKGVDEGDYAWDRAPPQGHSAMINASVGAASGTAQRTIPMNYKGGSRKLVVPANVPVVKVAPGTNALLVADAAFVVVGKNGVKLPM